MSHSDLESPNPTCDHQGIHSSLKMLLLREENLLLLLPTCVWEPPADRQAGELEQAQANSWEKSSFLLKLGNFKTDNFLCMLIMLGKGKTLQKEQTVRDGNSVCHHSTGEQSAGSVMRSNGCITKHLRLWFSISTSIGICDHTTPSWTPLILIRGGHFISHDHILLLRSCPERLLWGNSPKHTLKDMPTAKKFPPLYHGTRYLFPFRSVPDDQVALFRAMAVEWRDFPHKELKSLPGGLCRWGVSCTGSS